MGWLPETEDQENEKHLHKRVVAAFYLLACIAGLTCVMPLKARLYVLGRLRAIEANAIEIVSNRAYDCGLEFLRHDYLIADALSGGDSWAEALRLFRNFRLLAILLDHLIEHYPCRRTGAGDTGLFATGNAPPFVVGNHRAGNRLTTLARSLSDATERQLRAAPMRLAFEPIDSS